MAGAKPGVHVVQLKQIVVPKSLQDGVKSVKWDDESTVGTPVTLRVDGKGFFLYWTDQNKETEFLDISSIRDARTGKFARVPKDGKLQGTVNMGAQDTPLEDKTVTVVYGPELVNVTFINFCCNCRETAKEWADEIMKMAYNLMALNASATTFLEKAYTKLILPHKDSGKVPVKSIMKMFTQKNPESQKRVEKALEISGYAAAKTDVISPSKLTFEDFFGFYKNLTGRLEVENIFEELCGGSKKKNSYLSPEQLTKFLNDTQRDPRLNEILYPFTTVGQAKEIINQYEPNKSLSQKGLLSVEGFLRYLMSDDNAIMAPEKYDLNADMNQPLSHYFINSSHNTYLTGHQLTGKSSVEMYRQCLLAGCRCIELDCWDGQGEEPVITHGYTVVTLINYKEVIDAIAESAFKTSNYPVILSFENHCGPKQQAIMANYCIKVFGDMLQSEPLPSHPIAPAVPLPSPNQLFRKIIIKNKKKHSHHRGHGGGQNLKKMSSATGSTPVPAAGSREAKADVPRLQKTSSKDSNGEPTVNGDEVLLAPNGDLIIKDSESSSSSEDEDEVSGAEDPADITDKEQGTAYQESEAGAELSALVNYIQPVHFHGFGVADEKNKSYEISSFVETVATNLLKERPVEFVNYNKRQLSRLYPRGTRVDSSNYMPQVFWNAGCQLVALNFQTLDLPLQINLGIFEYNGRSGYLLKPDFMRRHDRRFDPFAESTVDGIIAGALHVQILSGQFLSDKRVGTYVEVETYGLPADTFRKKFRTKVVPNNGINPVYDEAPFVLKKVVLPDLAVLRIAVYEEGGKMIGHRFLPIVGLRPGYRHVCLRNESGQSLMLPTLFVRIVVKDYVSDVFSDFANALANPIEHLSQMEERARALDKLLVSDDVQPERTQYSPAMKPGAPFTPVKTNPPNNSSFERTGSVKDGMNGSPHHNIPSPKVTTDSTGKPTRVSVISQSDAPPEPKAIEMADVVLVAEPLEKIKQDSKLVQNVLSKLEKDLAALRKKHDKAVTREQELKQQKEEKLTQTGQDKKSTLAKTHSRLLKKFSKTNVKEGTPPKRSSESDEVDASPEQVSKLRDLHRTHSQLIITLFKDHYKTELEVREKYHEPMYNAVEKAVQMAQAAQMKELNTMHDNEKSEMLKGLESIRLEEVKNLRKIPRTKDELTRLKREIDEKHIQNAVTEIQKLKNIYEDQKKDIERQHEEVRKKLEEEKAKAFEKLRHDYKQHCAKVEQECAGLISSSEITTVLTKDVTSL